LVLFGGSSLNTNREETIQLALEDAARKAAVYEGAFAIDRAKPEIIYSPEYQKYTAVLEFDPERDILQVENTLFIRTRYFPASAVGIRYQKYAGSGERPSWIEEKPEVIPGFDLAVGYSGRMALHRDTVNRSFEAALSGIVQTRGLGDRGAKPGTVKGFCVLDIWFDPVTKGVWTLGAAKK